MIIYHTSLSRPLLSDFEQQTGVRKLCARFYRIVEIFFLPHWERVDQCFSLFHGRMFLFMQIKYSNSHVVHRPWSKIYVAVTHGVVSSAIHHNRSKSSYYAPGLSFIPRALRRSLGLSEVDPNKCL